MCSERSEVAFWGLVVEVVVVCGEEGVSMVCTPCAEGLLLLGAVEGGEMWLVVGCGLRKEGRKKDWRGSGDYMPVWRHSKTVTVKEDAWRQQGSCLGQQR
jgi:hypothetical protein